MTDAHHALLQADEEPLAFESIQIMGADLSGVSRQPRIFGGWSWNPFDGGIQPDDHAVNMRIVGVGTEGPVGSTAQRFTAACRAGTRMLLTSKRLILTDTTTGGLQLDVKRADIGQISADWRLFQAGRVAITFTDGSIVRPHMGLIVTRARNRFLRAID